MTRGNLIRHLKLNHENHHFNQRHPPSDSATNLISAAHVDYNLKKQDRVVVELKNPPNSDISFKEDNLLLLVRASKTETLPPLMLLLEASAMQR